MSAIPPPPLRPPLPFFVKRTRNLKYTSKNNNPLYFPPLLPPITTATATAATTTTATRHLVTDSRYQCQVDGGASLAYKNFTNKEVIVVTLGAIVGLAVVVGLAGWWWAEIRQPPSLTPNSTDGHSVSQKPADSDEEEEEAGWATAERQGDVLTEEQDRWSKARGASTSVAYLMASTIMLTGPNG